MFYHYRQQPLALVVTLLLYPIFEGNYAYALQLFSPVFGCDCERKFKNACFGLLDQKKSRYAK